MLPAVEQSLLQLIACRPRNGERVHLLPPQDCASLAQPRLHHYRRCGDLVQRFALMQKVSVLTFLSPIWCTSATIAPGFIGFLADDAGGRGGSMCGSVLPPG